MRSISTLLVSIFAGVALTTGIAAAESSRTAGRVMAVAGPVVVARPDVIPHPLKFKDSLYWRDVVETRKDGIARVLLGGKATVTVRELSSLELREEKRTEGVRYVADLVSGKVRASVARMLMQPGEQVEVWTFNTVASVRGTDFIVEVVERPTQAGTFGLMEVRQVAQVIGDRASSSKETVVVTLSGLVAVSNPLSGTGRTELIGPYEASRVSGRQDPVHVQVGADQVKAYLSGLTPPRPQQARSGDKSDAVEGKVEGAALAASVQNGNGVGQGDRLQEHSQQGDQGSKSAGNGQSAQGSSQSTGNGSGNGLAVGGGNGGGNGSGNGLAVGGGNGGGNGSGNGFALGQGGGTGNVPPGLAKKGWVPPGQAKKK